jgi:hypothetical protein
MKKVVLIGTSHPYQIWDGTTDPTSINQFRHLLSGLCSQYEIETIAKEMNPEALAESGASESVAQRVASEFNIQHQFSDPTRAVRQQLGILQENDIRAHGFINNLTEQQIQSQITNSHLTREQYWLDKLGSLALWPVIVICGADHTESFYLCLPRRM